MCVLFKAYTLTSASFFSTQRSFGKYQQKPLLKQLHTSELKGQLFVDQMPLNALYKVRKSELTTKFYVLCREYGSRYKAKIILFMKYYPQKDLKVFILNPQQFLNSWNSCRSHFYWPGTDTEDNFHPSIIVFLHLSPWLPLNMILVLIVLILLHSRIDCIKNGQCSPIHFHSIEMKPKFLHHNVKFTARVCTGQRRGKITALLAPPPSQVDVIRWIWSHLSRELKQIPIEIFY